jgi:HPt (histidine-containing phosphotransfer) domain-containing protein
MLKLGQPTRKSRLREDGNARQIVTVIDDAGNGESALLLDSHAILASFGGQWTLLKEIAEMTLADGPERIEEIENAIAKREAKAIQHPAHQLRGSVGMFHAAMLTEILRRLEKSGREGNLSGAERDLPGLRTEFHRFSIALRSWITA